MARETSEDQYLYRILPFERVVQIFESCELHFSHPTRWEDPYESAVEDSALQSTYAQCWCSKGVSDAMWRIYSPQRIGARIKVKKSVLTSTVRAAARSIKAKYKVKKVTYLAESLVKGKIATLQQKSILVGDPTVALNALFYKRLAYSHESEFRAVIYDASGTNGSIEKGLRIGVDPHHLIDSILFDPRAPDEVVHAFEMYLKKSIKYTKSIGKSMLYRGIVKMET